MGARDATDAQDQQPERQGQDAPGAQDQQPGKSKAVKGQVAPSARSKTTKGRTRDKDVARALGPDVVDDKGQRVPFSRRGRDSQSSSDDDDTKTNRSTGIQACQAWASHAAHDRRVFLRDRGQRCR